jgi:basic membrane lipoprotein Med (substrate-binding protein (PBP1-ABC) superfamily)
MLKRVDTSVILTLTALANDTFNAGPITLDIVSDGIDYAKTNKALKTSVIDKVDSAKIQIMKGIIKVIPTYEAAYNAGVAPKNLKALDN